MNDPASGFDVLEATLVLQRIGLAVALGLLVGMQRERARSRIAGVRTFPLITVWGTLSALLALRFGGAMLAAGAGSLAAVMVVENVFRDRSRGTTTGVTTEAAALVMFATGAILVVTSPLIAIVISGGLAFLLHQKRALHRLVQRIGDADFRVIMQFTLISLVILPVLPDRPFGPWDTLNPFRSWLMVVLIVGIGLAGWVTFKAVGSRTGVLLGGLLGGLVSSTATTVTYARSGQDAKRSTLFAQLVIMLASTVAFARVLVEVTVVAPGILVEAAPPLAIVLVAMMILSGALYAFSSEAKVELPEAENPAALMPALAFGAIYTIVSLASAAAQAWLGPKGLYAVAALAGLTDVDAITLSTASLAGRDALPVATAWRVILVASLVNLAFKLGIVCAIAPRLAPRIALPFGVAGAVGLALVGLWPDG
jgi:uncharacterized membrane protein (DUF4010 family)